MDTKDEVSIVDQYRGGATQAAIAKAFGVSVPTILRVLAKHDVPIRWKNTPHTREEYEAMADEMLAMHKTGTPYREIGEKFGLSSAGAFAAVKRAATRKRKAARAK